MKTLKQRLDRVLRRLTLLILVGVFGIALSGLASNVFAYSISALVDTGSINPSSIAIDGTGNIYVTAGLPSQNVGISKVAGASLTSVYSDIGLQYTNGVAVGSDYLFWGNASSGSGTSSLTYRAPQGGSGPITTLGSTGVFDLSDMFYQDGFLYTADYAYGKVVKNNLSGSPLQTWYRSSWSGSYEHLISVVVADGKIFEGDREQGLFSAPLTGGNLTQLATGNFNDIAYLNDKIYAIGADAQTIWEIPATGGTASVLIEAGTFGNLISMAAYNGMLYLTDTGLDISGNNADGTVWQVDPDAAPVPEPATMLLLGSGLAWLAGFRRKIKAQKG